MFNSDTIKSTMLAAVAALFFATISVGAAVGPAQVSTTVASA